jgi:hypothetical protein
MLKRDTFVKAIKFLVAGFVFGGVVLALLPDTNASDLNSLRNKCSRSVSLAASICETA